MKKWKIDFTICLICLGLSGCGKTDIPVEEATFPTNQTASNSEIATEINQASNEEVIDEKVTELVMYQRFLGISDGETVSAIVDKDFYGCDEGFKSTYNQDTASLFDLREYIDLNYLQFFEDGNKNPTVSYAYIDCGNDGKFDLAIKFSGLNIYEPDDDSFAVFVVTEREEQLYLTFSYACWARSYTEMNNAGYITGDGSAGAGDHILETAILDQNAKYHNIYKAEELGGWWISYLNSEAYQNIFGDEEPDIRVIKYTIDDKDICLYEAVEEGSEISDLSKQYIDECANAGIIWVSLEEVENMIHNNEKKYSISDDILSAQEPAWIILE